MTILFMGKPGIHGTNVISVGARGTRVSRAVESLLLADGFNGSGALADHNPDTVWTWDNWRYAGQPGETWTLSGSGTVSQTSNPGSGVRAHYAYMLAASSDPLIRVSLRTPTSGNFRCGAMGRDEWFAVLNKSNNRLELVQSTTVHAFVAAGTLLNNTDYIVELECYGTTLIARGAGVQCSFTSSGSQTKLHAGIIEEVGVTDGHPLFQSIQIQPSLAAGVTAKRVFYSPANANPALEYDAEVNSGVADTVLETGSGNGVYAMQITANGTQNPESGTRLQFQFDASGTVPAKQAASAVKNLPDEAYYTCYYFIPSVIQRLSSFWMIMQMKQRNADGGTYPLYSFNLGYTAPNMHVEPNSNMGASGEFDNDMPDLSAIHFTFPAGQWVRLDMLYKWGIVGGRLAFWLDNVLLWDFVNIRTQFSEPAAAWIAAQNPRQVSVTHYAANLSPATSKIYTDNFSVTVGGRPPDNYPVEAPV